jgi:agmatine/peptidylarginine deiminase
MPSSRPNWNRCFPDRDIYMIDASAIADAGGGIHCVTNDQPASV